MVRPYTPSDRERVRFVCHQTGYLGQSIGWQWRDTRSFADMFSGYYTDREPESAFVVEVEGVVAGYLLGCVDSARAWAPEAVAVRHVLRRGLAFRPGTAPVLWRSAVDIVGDRVAALVAQRTSPTQDAADAAARAGSEVVAAGAGAGHVDLERWPAHLHIDLLPEARGQGVGRVLLGGWLDRLRAERIRGCHLHTFAENAPAIAFFASVGFVRLGGAERAPGLRARGGQRLHTQAMALDL